MAKRGWGKFEIYTRRQSNDETATGNPSAGQRELHTWIKVRTRYEVRRLGSSFGHPLNSYGLWGILTVSAGPSEGRRPLALQGRFGAVGRSPVLSVGSVRTWGDGILGTDCSEVPGWDPSHSSNPPTHPPSSGSRTYPPLDPWDGKGERKRGVTRWGAGGGAAAKKRSRYVPHPSSSES